MTINNNTSQRETMMQLATKYSDLLVYLDENNVNQDTILPIIKHAIKIGVISEDAIKRLNKGTGTKRGVNQLRFDDVKKHCLYTTQPVSRICGCFYHKHCSSQ